jgi:very-short-patch-repair endonuclease
MYNALKEYGKNPDIIIPEYKIIIEYDGEYWHQDKEKDLERQKKIENLGYIFIRYNGGKKDKIPSKDQIKKDIIEVILK